MSRLHNPRRPAPRALLLLFLALALPLAGCDQDIDITAPRTPTFDPGSFTPGGASQTIQISGTLSAAEGSCLEATILYDGQELAGARTGCAALRGCARLELRAMAIPRSVGHHTIAFQVLDQSLSLVEYWAEGNVRIEMDDGQVLDMSLGPQQATLSRGESVTFEADFL